MTLSVKAQHTNAVWGNQRCELVLPGFVVEFCGLSQQQETTLSKEFADFIVTENQHNTTHQIPKATRLVCTVHRLNCKLNLPVNELEVDGQYSPILRRGGDLVEITGHNFIASFATTINSCDAVQITEAKLSVFAESDFTHLTVVENFLRFYTAYNAVRMSGAVLHSAGLVIEGDAFLFAGYSNVGKTTLTRKAHHHGCTVLSDDLNLLLPSGDSTYRAYKVPFTGEFGRTIEQGSLEDSYPLKAIVLLEQAEDLSVEPVRSVQAVSRLLACSPFVNNDDMQIKALLDIHTDLALTLPIIKLKLCKDSRINNIIPLINELV